MPSPSESGPLKRLLISDADVEASLSEFLEPFIRIHEAEVSPLQPYHDLAEEAKILVFLAAVKALAILGRTGTDRIKPKPLAQMCMVNYSSTRVYLRKFVDERIIGQDKNGYFLPHGAIHKLKAKVNEVKS